MAARHVDGDGQVVVTVFAVLRTDYPDFLYLRANPLQEHDTGGLEHQLWAIPWKWPVCCPTLGSRLLLHVDPVLALLAPVAARAGPLMLGGCKIAASALGALPVFWLGRRHVFEKVAAMLALAYLVYIPWTAWNVLGASTATSPCPCCCSRSGSST